MAEIILEIDGDTKKLESKLDNRNISKVGVKSGDRFRVGFENSVRNIAIGNIVADAARGAIRLFSRELSQGIRGLRDFSKGIAESNSILGKTDKITKETTQTFIEFSRQFGTDQARQVDAFYSIVSAGVKGTANQLETLRRANVAATAGLVDIDQAAFALVSSVNAYSAAGITAEQVSDDLFTAVRVGQTTFGELATTIGTVAPIAASLGVGFGELSGAIAAITKGGIDTRMAVVGLRQAFLGIIKPSEQAKEAAAEFGVELGENAIKEVGGLANFLEILIDKTGGSAEALGRIFTSAQAITPILSIASRGVDGFRKTLDEVSNSAGSTATAFEEIKQSVDFEFKQLESELAAFRVELAGEFLPVIRELVPALRAAVPLLKELGSAAGTTARGFAVLAQSANDFFENRSAAASDQRLQRVERLNRELAQVEIQLDRIAKIEQRGTITPQDALLLGQQRGLEDRRADIEQRLFAARVDAEGDMGEQFGPFEEQEQQQEQQPSLVDTLTGNTPDSEPEEKKVEASKENLQTLGQAFASTIDGVKNDGKVGQKALDNFGETFVSLGNTARDAFAGGVAQAFAQVGAALQEGENAFEAFGASLIGSLGEISQQIGQAFILQGAGYLLLNPAFGGALIAAGAALSTFGGFLSSTVAAAPSAGSSGSAGASRSKQIFEDSNDAPEPIREEDRRVGQNVQLVVQGDILDSEDTGRRLVDLLNSNFESDNSALVGARFA